MSREYNKTFWEEIREKYNEVFISRNKEGKATYYWVLNDMVMY